MLLKNTTRISLLNVCPNLIYDQSGPAVIKAKLVAPLILVNSAGQMIDRDGNNTNVYYSYLQPYLKANGHIKDCANDKKCKEFAETMKDVAWESDKTVVLKVPSRNTEKTSTYSYDVDNQDIHTPTDTNLI